jgi:predicted RNase H-like HicB family nuclease
MKDLEYYMALPYTKELRRNSDGTFFAKIRELRGCMTEGDTEKEALEMLRDAMAAWIESALDFQGEVDG